MAFEDLTEGLAEIFGEYATSSEDAFYREHQRRLAKRRDDYRLNHAARKAAIKDQRACRRRVTEQLKLIRAAREKVLIEPIGRPPALAKRIRKLMIVLLVKRRKAKQK